MKIDDYKAFEGKKKNKDIDPYGEENWSNKPEKPVYNGNAIQFIRSIEDAEIQQLLDDMLGSDDLDERMDLADQILSYVEDEFPEIWDTTNIEDDIKDLTLD